jgi:hypothetical protein
MKSHSETGGFFDLERVSRSLLTNQLVYNNHMRKKGEVEHHDAVLRMIEHFTKPKSGLLVSKNATFNGLSAKFKHDKKRFTINFQYDIFSKKVKDLGFGKYHKGIQIRFNETTYNLERVFIGRIATPMVTATVDRIHSKGFSEKRSYYYRLVIPLEEELNFHFQIEETHFSTDLGYRSRTGTSANINGEAISVRCVHNKKNEHFFVIDSSIKQSCNEFAEKAHAVKMAMGYMSGYLPGNQGFFFAYSQKEMEIPIHFRCVGLSDSIRSTYNPVYSNPYGYLSQNKSQAKKYYPLLRPVFIREFSGLCEKIHGSLEFASALLLILESSVASLLFMPGGYAIALETISDLVIGNNKLKLAPIKDKQLSRKIRTLFLEVLEQNCTSIAASDRATLKIRIEQLNQITNKARLRAPFELLGITLDEEDLRVLETRNNFLHGRVPDLTDAGVKRSTDRINKDLYYCSMRFYTLLNMIILKWVGYDNRVVNYPKIQEMFTQIRLKEEPFRQV